MQHNFLKMKYFVTNTFFIYGDKSLEYFVIELLG